ncbi:MAG TPA: SHOCT domain-containing protein [Spirochaetia bacterium]|nr:SHOCT domain-containing protein [Spirochaetia bacterium]
MFGGMLIPLAIVVLVVWLLFRGFKTWQGTPGTSQTEDPLNILKVRYAKGEITREEYEKIKKELKT